MDRQRGRSMQEEAKAELNRRGLWGYVEPILTMGSAAFAEPVSGMMGLAALPYGSDAATRAINRTQEAMTYQPRTEDGQQGLQDAAEFMQPVGDAFIGASEYLGDAAYDATGSPALGAAAYSVPTMALEALGLKGVKAASKGRAAYEMGDIGSQASKYGGKQRGIFAGVKAKGADLDKMEAAKELANRGLSRDEIWQKTGWFEDVDGNWKWEIDDSGAGFDMTPSLEAQKRGAPYSERFPFIGESIEHRQLLGYQGSAYDDLDNIRLQVDGKTTKGGSYGQSANLAEGINPKGEFIELSDDLTGSDAKSVALHELQHAIQEREGFARGGSPERLGLPQEQQFELARKAYEAASGDEQILAELGIDVGAPKARRAWDELSKREKVRYLEQGREMAYMRLAGEAEARNVQTRLDYTPKQRRATPPWQTLDVPEDELIVRRGNGVAMSVPKGMKRLYRGLEREFDPNYDTTRTDAPNDYSTWTDNPDLARQYAGEKGYVYAIDLPESRLGNDIMDADGERHLFFNNEKPAALNGVSGDEYLLYLDHDDYSPERIKLFE